MKPVIFITILFYLLNIKKWVEASADERYNLRKLSISFVGGEVVKASSSSQDNWAEEDPSSDESIKSDTLEQNNPEFKQKCIELNREIKAFAKDQLDLKFLSDKLFHFNDYEIENWPGLVSFRLNSWDQKAYDDLRKALPSLVFKKKSQYVAYFENSSKRSKKPLREILDRLLAIFNEQTGEKSARVLWIKYNLVGWPARVNLAVDRLNSKEILAVLRHIDFIKFLPLEPGQRYRYVEFSDGSRWEFKGKVPNRKEFAELLRKHDEATAKNQTSPMAVDGKETEIVQVIPSDVSGSSSSSKLKSKSVVGSKSSGSVKVTFKNSPKASLKKKSTHCVLRNSPKASLKKGTYCDETDDSCEEESPFYSEEDETFNHEEVESSSSEEAGTSDSSDYDNFVVKNRSTKLSFAPSSSSSAAAAASTLKPESISDSDSSSQSSATFAAAAPTLKPESISDSDSSSQSSAAVSDSEDSAAIIFAEHYNPHDQPVALEQNDPEFRQKCIELTREIKAFAKGQLKLDYLSDRLFNFNDYEIENWPELVPYHLRNWDQKAYDDLCEALPSLVFKKKTVSESTMTEEASKNLKKIRRDLLDKLVVIFNETTGENSNRVKWLEYNLIGWPARVNLAVDRLNRGEILAVLRHIDFIKFLQFQPGQKHRFVEFSDGSIWEFEGKVPRKKEFAEMLKKHDLAAKKLFSMPIDSAHNEKNMDVIPSSSSNPSNLNSNPTSRKRKLSEISSHPKQQPKQPRQPRKPKTTQGSSTKSAPRKTSSKPQSTPNVTSIDHFKDSEFEADESASFIAVLNETMTASNLLVQLHKKNI